ncbi:hypothetical protein [Aliikangiella sp. IMCC44359]|uniref:hypothetical protein n=1 Tax=Aliikangiella sp. IMCC44359 TaxID=3459125 RepID=UPI00403AAF6D
MRNLVKAYFCFVFVCSIIYSVNISAEQAEQKTGRKAVYSSAVKVANFIDRFFGQNDALESANYDYLRLVTSVHWQETEKIDYAAKLKAKVRLPQMNEHFSLIFDERDSVFSDETKGEVNHSSLPLENKSSSAALNYESDKYKRFKFDTRIGLGSHLEPFVLFKHTYRPYQSDKMFVKNINSVFWREKKGYGASVRMELDRIINVNNLFRWNYTILRAEKSLGNEWINTFSIINHMSKESWLSYDFNIKGRSANEFAVEEYRLALRYRKQLDIDWLYYEIEPEFLWRRTPEQPKRNFYTGLILRFEIRFED